MYVKIGYTCMLKLAIMYVKIACTCMLKLAIHVC
jgi:hypothetical protein